MENKDAILSALTEFGEKPESEIPTALEQYLVHIAKTGETLFPWPKLQPLFAQKLDNVMKTFHSDCPMESLPTSKNSEKVQFDDMRTRLLNQLNAFTGAPFTIQRLCELVTEPRKQYKRTDKFLRGIERNVLVVSTVDTHGNKIVREETKKPIVNGDLNGDSDNTSENYTNPHSWVTGHITTSWPGTEGNNEQEELSGESPSKKPRLSYDDEQSNTSTSEQDNGPTDSLSTECIASTSNTDTNTSEVEETSGGAPSSSSSSCISASSSNSSSSSNESLPEQSHPEQTPNTSQNETITDGDEGISQSESVEAPNNEISQSESEVSGTAEMPSDPHSEAVSSSDSETGTSVQESENEAIQQSSEAVQSDVSAFHTEDSTGFETSNIKSADNSCQNSGDNIERTQSEDVESSHMSEEGDQSGGPTDEASAGDVSSSDMCQSEAVDEQTDTNVDTSSESEPKSTNEAESEEPMDAE